MNERKAAIKRGRKPKEAALVAMWIRMELPIEIKIERKGGGRWVSLSVTGWTSDELVQMLTRTHPRYYLPHARFRRKLY